MKECTKCKIEKEESEFPFKNKAEGKLSTICKVCHRAYKLKHYENNKEQHYERNEKQRTKLKDYVKEYKLLNPCIKCGESEPVCLDFHHLDPNEKENEVSRITSLGSLNKVIKEIEKCVILCSNCHRKIHAGIIDL